MTEMTGRSIVCINLKQTVKTRKSSCVNARGMPGTAHICLGQRRRRRGEVGGEREGGTPGPVLGGRGVTHGSVWGLRGTSWSCSRVGGTPWSCSRVEPLPWWTDKLKILQAVTCCLLHFVEAARIVSCCKYN